MEIWPREVWMDEPGPYTQLLRIRQGVYRGKAPVEVGILPSAEPIPFGELDKAAFTKPYPGQRWGRKPSCCWLRITGRVPEGLQNPVLLVGLHGEGLVYKADGSVHSALSTVYIQGDLPHSGGRFRPVENFAAPGQAFELYIDCGFNGLLLFDIGQGRYDGACLARRDETCFGYYYDYMALLVLAAKTQDKGLKSRLRTILQESYGMYRGEGAAAARAVLAPQLAAPSNSDFVLHAVGHGHLDMAWLWPLRETHRKAQRTYTNALNNMEKYPWYIYGTSQPQQLAWIQAEQPAMYAGLQKAAAGGRLELQGGFWVECDTNITGGESLVRQALYGQRFMQEEFGQTMRICWLPDVFGYSGNLPQILQKTGMPYFSTIKLQWNKVNTFPHRSFYWEGIDGSRVLVHMPPEGDYNSRADAGSILRAERQYPEKETGRALLVYGAGDGGGGPGEVHMELLAREGSLEGLPRVESSTALDFFKALEADGVAPVHKGELYLETHQGTYTTQGKIKRYNRMLERLLHNAEALWALRATGGAAYPYTAFEAIWKEVLLNQFHDIIPGSSITRVNTEAHASYAAAKTAVEALTGKALVGLAGKKDEALCALNLTSFARQEAVRHKGAWYTATLAPYSAGPLEAAPPAEGLLFDAGSMDNGRVRLRFNEHGEIASMVADGRELAHGPLNCLMVYCDPFQFPFDAWDISMSYYKKPPRRLRAAFSKTYRDGPRIVREQYYRFGRSRLRQRIVLEAGSDLVRFETEADWHENHRMLRANFAPVDRADTVLCDIQFGAIRRSTREDTSIETAQFEVCAHKWIAMEGEAGGFALLNNCKYGHRAKNGLFSLNLLRAPTFPDKTADRGRHHFTYAICPFAVGDTAKVVREGYRLNNPLLPVHGVRFASLAGTGNPAVVIETIKAAEDGSGTILRLYESLGAPTTCALQTVFKGTAWECDLLENPEKRTGLKTLEFGPYECKTILVKRG